MATTTAAVSCGRRPFSSGCTVDNA